jgi:hypothetical protein
MDQLLLHVDAVGVEVETSTEGKRRGLPNTLVAANLEVGNWLRHLVGVGACPSCKSPQVRFTLSFHVNSGLCNKDILDDVVSRETGINWTWIPRLQAQQYRIVLTNLDQQNNFNCEFHTLNACICSSNF